MYFAYLVIFQILADNSSVKYSWKCQGNEMPSRLSDIVSARSSRKWLILGIGLVSVVIICVSISVPLATAARRNREASSLDIANRILEKFPLIDGWVEILFLLPYDYDTYLAFIYFFYYFIIFFFLWKLVGYLFLPTNKGMHIWIQWMIESHRSQTFK